MNMKALSKKYLPIIVLVGTLLLYLIAIYTPKILFFIYPLWIYKIVSQGFSHLFSLLPFSFAELFVLLHPIIGLYLLGKGLLRKKGARAYWHTMGKQSWKWACYILSFFILTAGINYHRTPLTHYVGLEVTPVQKEELKHLCLYLIDLTNAAAEHSRRNQEGRFIPNHTFNQYKMLIDDAYDSLSDHYPPYRGRYPSSKPLLFSYWVSYAHIMGFFFPFTFEVNINKDIPHFMIPAVIAHEQAHVRGLMREEEAEFSVYLLARHTRNEELRYSFYMSTLMRAMSALYRVDATMYKELTGHFSDFLTIDLNSYADYWDSFKSPIGSFSQTINDAYLKVNSQSDGVKSYGRVVDLLIADYKKNQTINNQNNENN